MKSYYAKCLVASIAMAAYGAFAADYYWVGGQSGDWDGANWATASDGAGATYTFTSSDRAVFTSAASVCLKADVTLKQIVLHANVEISGGYTITFDGDNSIFDVQVIGSEVTMTGGAKLQRAGYTELANGLVVNVGENGTFGTTSQHINSPNSSGNVAINVTGGKIMAGTNLNIARQGTAVGYLKFTGGELDATVQLGTRETAKGTMEVAAGAYLTTSKNILVGGDVSGNPNAEGNLLVTGGSLTMTGNDLSIGNFGKGNLSVTAGSLTLDDGKTLNVGLNAGSVGTAKLENATIGIKNVVVGSSGAGTLEVGEGVTLGLSNLTLGANAGSTGTLKVTGGTVTQGAWIPVGYSGTGIIEVTGGTFTQTSGNLQIGQNTGSEGAVRIGGTGAFSTSGEVFVGRNGGTGELTISASGSFTAPNYIWVISQSAQNSVHAELNLLGGTLIAEGINTAATAKENAHFNWNGGTLKPNERDVVPIKNADKLVIDVGAHGALFDSNGKDREINAPLSGVGFFKKLGSGVVTLSGALDLDRGYVVEEGTLAITGTIAESSEAQPLKEISVATGATLNLNGQTVYVQSYKDGGVSQAVGEYSAHGGTIKVVDAVVANAVWTNADGDGDVENPYNWTCYNADGVVVWDAVPTSATPVTIPEADYNAFDFSGFSAVTIALAAGKTLSLLDLGAHGDEYSYSANSLLAQGNMKILNNINGVLYKAEAWYDPSDATTLTTNGSSVTAIANKGYRGAGMNAVATDANSVPAVTEEAKINGNGVLVFGAEGQTTASVTYTKGFKAAGRIPSTTDQQRAMFSVAKIGSVTNPEGTYNEFSRVILADLSDTAGDGGWFAAYKGGINQWDFNPYANLVMAEGGAAMNFRCGEKVNSTDESNNGTRANASTETVYVYETSLINGSFTSTGWMNNNGQQGGNPATYHALTASATGCVDLYVGQRKNGEGTSGNSYIGETLVFANPLTTAEYGIVRDYLKGKWLTGSGDALSAGATTLGSLALADNARVDFDGAAVSLGNVAGYGTVTNAASIAVTGTVSVDLADAKAGGIPTFSASEVDFSGATLNITGLADYRAADGDVVVARFTPGVAAQKFGTVVYDVNKKCKLVYDNAAGTVTLTRNKGLVLIIR